MDTLPTIYMRQYKTADQVIVAFGEIFKSASCRDIESGLRWLLIKSGSAQDLDDLINVDAGLRRIASETRNSVPFRIVVCDAIYELSN